MPETTPNPSYTMGRTTFLWDNVINPSIQSGEIEDLAAVVLDLSMKGQITLESTRASQWRRGSFAQFNTVIHTLSNLADELRSDTSKPTVLEHFRFATSRYLSQMDMIMRGDEVYEKVKQEG